jgi:hypothetical protein
VARFYYNRVTQASHPIATRKTDGEM